jgi:hypothetical protein
VFVGKVALTPYETPGTIEFARTVTHVARQHNTILLANHGVVCWADTVTHAEWFVEIVETYCKTLMIALQLRSPLPELHPSKIEELLKIKASLGLPDARLPLDTGGEWTGDLETAALPIGETTASNSEWHSLPLEDQMELDELIVSLTARINAILSRNLKKASV